MSESWLLYIQNHAKNSDPEPTLLTKYFSLEDISREIRAQARYANLSGNSQHSNYLPLSKYNREIPFSGWRKELSNTIFKLPDDQSYPKGCNYLPIAMIGHDKAYFAIKEVNKELKDDLEK